MSVSVDTNNVIYLPCNVGDIVWAPYWLYAHLNTKNIVSYQITNLTVTQNKKGVWTKKYRAMEVRNGKTIDHQLNFDFEALGKTVFLTKEEAEQEVERRTN